MVIILGKVLIILFNVALQDEYIQQKREGKLQCEGAKEDILTKALETQEYSGRVRGIGGHINPTIYFNVGRTRKKYDVTLDIIAEHKRELKEAKMQILEQDVRIQKLEALMHKRGAWDNSIDDKGSCSVKFHQKNIEEDDVQIVGKDEVLQVKYKL